MKSPTIVTSTATTLVLGTAAAIPAENAIRNDISKLKGKSFKDAYKNGYWKVRFFRADYGFDLLKQNKPTLDGNTVCKLNNNEWNYWLYELTKKEFQSMLSNLAGGSDVYFLLLVEFRKNNDWFNRSVDRAWFGISGTKKTNSDDEIIRNRKQQILKIFDSKNETLTEEVFTALNNEESNIGFKDSNGSHIYSWYVHDDLLKSPLRLDMKKTGDCRKLEPKYRETV